MTFADFIAAARAAGVRDTDELAWIDYNAPYAVHVAREPGGAVKMYDSALKPIAEYTRKPTPQLAPATPNPATPVRDIDGLAP